MSQFRAAYGVGIVVIFALGLISTLDLRIIALGALVYFLTSWLF